jgi:hypothetical protein
MQHVGGCDCALHIVQLYRIMASTITDVFTLAVLVNAESGSWRQLEHCFLQESLHCRRPEHHLPVLCSAAAEHTAVLQDRQASWCHADPYMLVASSGFITEPEHLPQEQLSSNSSNSRSTCALLQR